MTSQVEIFQSIRVRFLISVEIPAPGILTPARRRLGKLQLELEKTADGECSCRSAPAGSRNVAIRLVRVHLNPIDVLQSGPSMVSRPPSFMPCGEG
jgi:hypothetical protein